MSSKQIPWLDWSVEEVKERSQRLLDLKPRFDIEASLSCNLDCIMCPRDQIGRQIRVMPRQIMEHLVNWLPPGPADIYFCGMGEPTLNKHLAMFLGKMKTEERHIGITTNAMTLDADLLKRLITAGIDFIQVSFNSLKPGVYRSIMKGADPERIFKNLDRLAAIKPEHLVVELAFTEQEANHDEIEDVKRFASARGFRVQHNLLHGRGGNLSHSWRRQERSEMVGCGIFSRRHFIDCLGNILACCHDLTGTTRLGNVQEISFRDLLEVKRKRIVGDQWFDICSPCDDITRLTDLMEAGS